MLFSSFSVNLQFFYLFNVIMFFKDTGKSNSNMLFLTVISQFLVSIIIDKVSEIFNRKMEDPL